MNLIKTAVTLVLPSELAGIPNPNVVIELKPVFACTAVGA